ncbi:hypothetical protein CYMTET_49233 [Cymbomonas tetramitiformis]|uniref:Uncharacterized protein n=1 Tax=Cymbomonas tetramitiformis TaxID=36881 RepID=A0AAE0BSA8_9CHLO|nr:hypothetical protein CYMTET_49233 [Cymbomonas tetramitiformis]
MALDDERVKKPQSENYNLFSMGVIVFLYSFWWQFSIRTGKAIWALQPEECLGRLVSLYFAHLLDETCTKRLRLFSSEVLERAGTGLVYAIWWWWQLRPPGQVVWVYSWWEWAGRALLLAAAYLVDERWGSVSLGTKAALGSLLEQHVSSPEDDSSKLAHAPTPTAPSTSLASNSATHPSTLQTAFSPTPAGPDATHSASIPSPSITTTPTATPKPPLPNPSSSTPAPALPLPRPTPSHAAPLVGSPQPGPSTAETPPTSANGAPSKVEPSKVEPAAPGGWRSRARAKKAEVAPSSDASSQPARVANRRVCVSICQGVDCSGGGGKATIVEVEELCREFEHANRPDALPDGALPYTVEVVSRVCQLQCDVGPNIDVYFRDRENHDELKWYYKKMDNAQDCRRLLKDVQAELKQPEEVLEDPGIMHRRAAAMRWDSLKALAKGSVKQREEAFEQLEKALKAEANAAARGSPELRSRVERRATFVRNAAQKYATHDTSWEKLTRTI